MLTMANNTPKKQRKTSDQIVKDYNAQVHFHQRAEESSEYAAGWIASRVGGLSAVTGTAVGLVLGIGAAAATHVSMPELANTLSDAAMYSFCGGIAVAGAVAATALAAHGMGIGLRAGARGIKNVQYNIALFREERGKGK